MGRHCVSPATAWNRSFGAIHMSDTDNEYLHDVWYSKANDNVDEWGVQNPAVILLAMQEEMGELSQSYLEAMYEDGEQERVREELDDLAALCVQFVWAIREHTDAFEEIGGKWE